MVDNGAINEGNPAERALSFIRQFKRIESELTRQTVRRPDVKEVLAVLYNLELSDVAQLQTAVANLWALPAQMKRELSQISGLDPKPYLKVVLALEKAMADLSLNSDTYSFVTAINQNMILNLEMISNLLRKDVQYPQLPLERRLDLANELNKIINDVKNSTLDDDFKIFAIDRLQAVIIALQQYDILGSAEVIAKVDNMYGGVVRQIPSIVQSAPKAAMAKRILKAMAVILTALNIGNGVLDMGQKAIDLIDDGKTDVRIPFEDQLFDDQPNDKSAKQNIA